MNRHEARKSRAFSLIEMMLVVVVMAILAALIIPRFVDQGRRGRESGLRHNLSQLRTAIATFQADTDRFPSVLSDLSATSAPAQGYDASGTLVNIQASSWHGPYIGALPNDPVSGAPFIYSVSAPNVGVVTSSAAGNDLSGTAFSTY